MFELEAEAWIPAPGWTRCAIARPRKSATVVMSSNQRMALPPTRPACLRSFMPAMPTTTVVKTIGPMSILMRFTNPSPSGFMAMPHPGRSHPRRTPRPMATRTWR